MHLLHLLSNLLALGVWTALALVIRHEMKPRDPWDSLARRDRRRG